MNAIRNTQKRVILDFPLDVVGGGCERMQIRALHALHYWFNTLWSSDPYIAAKKVFYVVVSVRNYVLGFNR